jgi:type II secretory pathway pseudopilin PulG
MSFLANNTARTAIQVVLAIVILVLGFVLFRTIREPYEAFEQQQELTAEARERMAYIRDAMRAYEREYDRFPTTLDSLVMLIESDSFLVAKRDSIFQLIEGDKVEVDSLPYSPRTGEQFDLTVVRDDSTNVEVYLLEDPTSDDYIGTDDPGRAAGALNAASWNEEI